jgi:hypothetical protein
MILQDLLLLIGRGGAQSYEDLAGELGISQPMLETLLEDLARRGYLRSLQLDCEMQCKGCHEGGCLFTGAGIQWSLTQSGARTSQRLAAAAEASRNDLGYYSESG